MERTFECVRLVVVQPEECIYFDKRYDNALVAMDKFNYFCKLANISYEPLPEFVFDRADRYNEISVYFPENANNENNQSGFVQISLYFEVAQTN